MGMEQFLASFRRGHNLPQLSTGHEDRLLPGSWTKDPSLPPAVVTRGLPVVPIPDTTTPPDKCYCICGEYFSTKARLRVHANGPHRPGTKHHVGLHFLARIGGAYALFNTVTHAVILAGMARFPVQCGDVPSSTLAEPRTILLAPHRNEHAGGRGRLPNPLSMYPTRRL